MNDRTGEPARSPLPGSFPREAIATLSGLEQLRAMIDGRLPSPPMAHTLNFRLVEVEEGRAVFKGVPKLDFYNPLGSVHGGWPATLLDSALGCAVHSTIAAGDGYTTLEFKVNIVRAIYAETGEVTAEGRLLYRGRRTATSDATLKDAAGRLYAHASTTCLIMPAA